MYWGLCGTHDYIGAIAGAAPALEALQRSPRGTASAYLRSNGRLTPDVAQGSSMQSTDFRAAAAADAPGSAPGSKAALEQAPVATEAGGSQRRCRPPRTLLESSTTRATHSNGCTFCSMDIMESRVGRGRRLQGCVAPVGMRATGSARIQQERGPLSPLACHRRCAPGALWMALPCTAARGEETLS